MTSGLFGGEFDPVHATHVRIAAEALGQAGLDRLLVVPNDSPPHRARARTPFEDRMEMLRLAMGDVPGAEVSDLERALDDRPCYTVDTVGRVLRDTGAGHLVLVVGADAMLRLDEWRHWRELAGMCGWLVVPRKGHDFLHEAPEVVLSELGGRLVEPAEISRRPGTAAMLDLEPTADASSAVREALRIGGAPETVPASVLAYIRERRLYG